MFIITKKWVVYVQFLWNTMQTLGFCQITQKLLFGLFYVFFYRNFANYWNLWTYSYLSKCHALQPFKSTFLIQWGSFQKLQFLFFLFINRPSIILWCSCLYCRNCVKECWPQHCSPVTNVWYCVVVSSDTSMSCQEQKLHRREEVFVSYLVVMMLIGLTLNLTLLDSQTNQSRIVHPVRHYLPPGLKTAHCQWCFRLHMSQE